MSAPLQQTPSVRVEDFSERAPLLCLRPAADTNRAARFDLTSLGHAALVARYDAEQPARESCGLADLTHLPRLGLRGKGTAAFLETLGYRLPAAPNQLLTQADGGMLLRLSASEYLLLGSLADKGEKIRALEQNLPEQADLYFLPRQDSHACFLLAGPRIFEVMAKLCGVDLRPDAFLVGAIAQTSVARLNAIVAHTGGADTPVFHLLFDRAASVYFWDALLDAMQEFNGGPIGFEAVAAL
ncbi:MAG: hypothetical protein LBS89_05410 [Zoogloeaceae bacterium]|nr:hypothetical protein [Zoogloeaceae bacterium]